MQLLCVSKLFAKLTKTVDKRVDKWKVIHRKVT